MHSQPTLDVEKVDSGEKSETLSSSQEPKDNEVPNSPHKIGNLRRAVVAVSTISAIFLYAVDDTIVADIQPSIIHSLQEIPKLPWISVAFRLGATCTNLIWFANAHFQMRSYRLICGTGGKFTPNST